MTRVQLRNAIICDRVYQDDYELAYINRIYPGKIILESVPSFLQLYIYCSFSVTTDAPVRIEYKMEGPRVRAGGAGLLDGSSDYFEVVAPFFTYLDSSAEIRFRWRLDDAKWSKSVRWAIEIAEEAVHLDEENATAIRALFNARGRASKLLDRGIIRAI